MINKKEFANHISEEVSYAITPFYAEQALDVILPIIKAELYRQLFIELNKSDILLYSDVDKIIKKSFEVKQESEMEA